MNPHSLNWKHRVLITGQLGKFHLFYNCKFVLNPLHMFRPAPHCFVSHQFDLSVSLFWIYFVCSFVLFFRFHIKEKSFSICLSVWVTFRIIFSRSTHVVANDKISFFLWRNNIPLYICMHVYIYPYPFISWWTLRLLPCLCYCKHGSTKHRIACIFLNSDFCDFW